MAKTLEVPIPQGATCTAKLLTLGTDTVLETISTLTERTNKKGWATGTIASTSGWAAVLVLEGTTNRGDFVVYVGADDPATYTAVLDTAIDWSKVQSPTTTVNFSGTTVATVTNQLTTTQVRDAVHDNLVLRGTADVGSTTTVINIKTLSTTPTVANQFKGRIILFGAETTTANLRGQGAPIDSNTTTTITLAAGDALTNAPAEDDAFRIQ